MVSPITQNAAMASSGMGNVQQGQVSNTAASMAAGPQGKQEVDRTTRQKSGTLGSTGREKAIMYGPNKRVESTFAAKGAQAVEKQTEENTDKGKEQNDNKVLDETA